jgi:hypothetical protein
MAPKKAADLSGKTVSAEVAAAILASTSVTIGQAAYGVMSQIDQTKTVSGWEHFFRPIKTRAKEISDAISNGDYGDVAGTAAKPKTPASGTKKSGGGKRGMLTSPHCHLFDNYVLMCYIGAKKAAEENGDDVQESPTKKIKKEAKDESGSDADAPGDVVTP